MDTFDGSKPNLISSKTLKDIESNLDIPGITESNKVINGLGTFYENYILPNMFPLIVIFLLILYLTIKYIIKKDREEKDLNGEFNEDSENEIKKKKIKKQMIKIDTDDIIYNRHNPIIKREADLISDEYLLTDDNESSDNDSQNGNQDENQDENQNNNPNHHMDDGRQIIDPNDQIMDNSMMYGGGIDSRDVTYDLNKATDLVFGKI
jgi:hypothetical protein